MLTEDEAKTKWCPYARLAGGQGMDGASYNRIEHYGGEISHGVATCLGSACMAWRCIAVADNNSEWAKAERQKFAPNGRGYCGLAGRPE